MTFWWSAFERLVRPPPSIPNPVPSVSYRLPSTNAARARGHLLRGTLVLQRQHQPPRAPEKIQLNVNEIFTGGRPQFPASRPHEPEDARYLPGSTSSSSTSKINVEAAGMLPLRWNP